MSIYAIFCEACKLGNLEHIKHLLTQPRLEKLKEHSESVINDGFHLACEYGHLDVVKYLLTSPELTEHADIHSCNNNGFEWAYLKGHLEVIEYGHLEVFEYLLTSSDLQSNNTFEDYMPIGFWFEKHGSYQMHAWISRMPQSHVDSLYEQHFELFFEKFTLEANLPLHTTSHQQQQEEIEIII